MDITFDMRGMTGLPGHVLSMEGLDVTVHLDDKGDARGFQRSERVRNGTEVRADMSIDMQLVQEKPVAVQRVRVGLIKRSCPSGYLCKVLSRMEQGQDRYAVLSLDHGVCQVVWDSEAVLSTIVQSPRHSI